MAARTPAKRAPRRPAARPAEQPPAEEQEQPAGRSVNMDRALAKMQVKAGQRETTITMLETVIEEQEEEIVALRAELVAATTASARTSPSS